MQCNVLRQTNSVSVKDDKESLGAHFTVMRRIMTVFRRALKTGKEDAKVMC